MSNVEGLNQSQLELYGMLTDVFILLRSREFADTGEDIAGRMYKIGWEELFGVLRIKKVEDVREFIMRGNKTEI